MVFTALFIAATSGATMPVASDEEAPEQVAMAPISPNPLMQLPGMRPARLPGVGAIPPAALPVETVSQVSNAPNPFDSRKGGLEGQTQLSYMLSDNYPVRVTVYDLLGFRVRRWDFAAGQEGGQNGFNRFLWDGTNEAGQKVAKGGYLAQIEVDTGKTIATAIRKIGVIH